MKKLIYILSALIFYFIGQTNVSAYGFSCTYQDDIHNRTLYYNLSTINFRDTNGTNELYYYDNNDMHFVTLPCSDTSAKCLNNLDVMITTKDRKGDLSCPNVYVNKKDGDYKINNTENDKNYIKIKLSDKECDYPNCNYYDQVDIFNNFTCQYKSSDGKEIITVNREVEGGDIYLINSNKESILLPNAPLNSSCPEFYYIEDQQLVRISNITTGHEVYKNLCRSYEDNMIKHFCPMSGCKLKDVSCNDLKKGYLESCNMTDIPKALPKYISSIINLFKILVPIVLVIMGMLDFLRAVIANDEKQMKESQSRFLKRVLAAVSIFFVVAVVQFTFRIVKTDGSFTECIDCFVNGTCKWIEIETE